MKDNRLGLLGIEERAALCGGTLRVESRLGMGTSLFVEFRV
jgi:signal transduction histidine kinase